MGKSRFEHKAAIRYGTVVDVKEHLLGRTAAVVARELLNGRNITVVRTEKMNIGGPELRNKRRFLAYLRKKHLTNPKKGPFHFRSPRMMFRRVVKGMLPKDKRGQEAITRLRIFEGVPKFLLSAGRRKCIPNCIRPTRFTPHRKFTVLGAISSQVGWNQGPVVERYEQSRIEEGNKWFQEKKKKNDAQVKAFQAAEKSLKPEELALLKKFGFAYTK
eukprot:PhF_6_TR3905/c0_g1_i1/m.5495/K02872/RP-L13Ae, RPL13A; large subunit ribosomal protein L13Ae